MKVEVLSTDKLGDRSYIVHDGQHAVVVDPQRDIDRVEEVLARHGVRASLVVESHMHNDYVTGGYELARQTGARYAVNADDAVSFDRLPVRDGDILEAGTLRVGVVATPGHTFNHLSYTITDTAEPEQPPAVFTGGSLLFGSVGRTDLLGDEFTDELTHAQFHSAHRLADALPDEASVYPTHGFGSFCSSGGAMCEAPALRVSCWMKVCTRGFDHGGIPRANPCFGRGYLMRPISRRHALISVVWERPAYSPAVPGSSGQQIPDSFRRQAKA